MCIAVIVSYIREDGKRCIIVLNNRDLDLTTKCLPLMSLSQVLQRYGEPITQNSSKMYGLFNDNKYANAQFVTNSSKGALLVDYRLHEKDPRRAIKTWGRERSKFCVDFVSGNESPMTFVEKVRSIPNQHPHTLVCWDTTNGCASYTTDGQNNCSYVPWTPNQTINEPFVFVAQTSGDMPNYRRDMMKIIAKKMCEPSVNMIQQGLNLLGNIEKPNSGDTVLSLGKPDEYEHHVESIRIPYRESMTRKGEMMQWATRTSVISMTDSVTTQICSRNYNVPTSVVDIGTTGIVDSDVITIISQ
jgi:hypothetical protein